MTSQVFKLVITWRFSKESKTLPACQLKKVSDGVKNDVMLTGFHEQRRAALPAVCCPLLLTLLWWSYCLFK